MMVWIICGKLRKLSMGMWMKSSTKFPMAKEPLSLSPTLSSPISISQMFKSTKPIPSGRLQFRQPNSRPSTMDSTISLVQPKPETHLNFSNNSSLSFSQTFRGQVALISVTLPILSLWDGTLNQPSYINQGAFANTVPTRMSYETNSVLLDPNPRTSAYNNEVGLGRNSSSGVIGQSGSRVDNGTSVVYAGRAVTYSNYRSSNGSYEQSNSYVNTYPNAVYVWLDFFNY